MCRLLGRGPSRLEAAHPIRRRPARQLSEKPYLRQQGTAGKPLRYLARDLQVVGHERLIIWLVSEKLLLQAKR
jgi:hypothetical protein